MFLATKVEESPRHLKNIIQEVYITRYRQHPSVRKKLLNEPRVYEMIKDRVLVVERSLLYTVGFDFNVDTPYKFLVEQIKKLNHSRALEYAVAPPDGATGNTAKMTQELVQYGMNYANDSLHTTLCLQFPAKTVASACTYLACRMCKVRPVGGRDWPEVLHVEPDALACE